MLLSAPDRSTPHPPYRLSLHTGHPPVDPHPFAVLVDLQKSFHWVLPTLNYESKEDLLDGENLKTYVIDRAVAKREELRKAKNQEPEPLLICKKKTSVPHDK